VDWFSLDGCDVDYSASSYPEGHASAVDRLNTRTHSPTAR
jgi:hypothetical protein